MIGRGEIAVVGAAETTQLGAIPGMSQIMLHADAALNAMAETGLKPKDIDGVACVGPMMPQQIAHYLGITPKWGNVTFNFAALYYTYPGASDIDYFEALGGATWTSGAWTLGFKDYWSPDNFQFFGQSNAIEGSVAYAFTSKLWNFFTPSISGTVGFQSYEYNADDYVYWNAGLTLGFLERWSADIRYYDTNYSKADCFINSGGRDNCDARAVGAIKPTF